jgi:maleate isomerase
VRPPTLDDRPVSGRIGLVVLATDHTVERDFARLMPPSERGVCVTRIAYANPTTAASLRAMQPRLVRTLPPFERKSLI